jgi:hypothetical protein
MEERRQSLPCVKQCPSQGQQAAEQAPAQPSSQLVVLQRHLHQHQPDLPSRGSSERIARTAEATRACDSSNTSPSEIGVWLLGVWLLGWYQAQVYQPVRTPAPT